MIYLPDQVWKYIEHVAHERAINNPGKYHVDNPPYNGEGSPPVFEMRGAAGEYIARMFLHMPTVLHTHHDGGVDMIFNGRRIDVKATRLSRGYQYLQWPVSRPIPMSVDVILETLVNLDYHCGQVKGFATRQELANANINTRRPRPCYEIHMDYLHDPRELFKAPAWG